MRQVSIVVVDGGSSDGTPAIVRALAAEMENLTLVDNPARLQSAGINRAVAIAATPKHDILVRCDAHARYQRGYVLRAATTLLENEATAVAAVMDARGANGFSRAAAWIVGTRLGSGGSAHRGGRSSGWVDHGHHAAVRLDWFRHVGGYDARFSHNEDAEFDHRLAMAGGRIWLDAGLRLDYQMRPTLHALARQYWRYGRGRARTIAKHRLRPRARQIAPAALAAVLVVAVAGAPVSSWTLLAPGGYLGLLAAVALAGAVRLRERGGLWAGPALGAMHLAWGAGFLRQVLAVQPPHDVDHLADVAPAHSHREA